MIYGGRGGIRTHEGAEPPAGFQDRCLKPLGHPSSFGRINNLRLFPSERLRNMALICPASASAEVIAKENAGDLRSCRSPRAD